MSISARDLELLPTTLKYELYPDTDSVKLNRYAKYLD